MNATAAKTRLRSQIWHVAATYADRPAFWLLILVAIAMVASGFSWTRRAQKVVRLAIVPRPWHSLEFVREPEFDKFLAEHDPARVRGLTLHNIDHSRGDPMLPPEIDQFTNLDALSLSGRSLYKNGEIELMRPADMQALAKLDKLTYFSNQFLTYAPGMLEQFGREHHIQTLVLDRALHPDRVDELRSFQTVEHLELKGVPLTPKLIDVVASLPRLRILTVEQGELNLHQDHRFIIADEDRLTAEDLRSLREHPRLQWVFADWPMCGLTQAEARTALSPVKSLLAHRSRKPQMRLSAALLTMVIITGAIAIQLWTQFVVPAAMVVPRYTRPHLLVPLGLLFVGLALSRWLAPLEDVAHIPLLTVCLYVPMFLCGYYWLQCSHSVHVRYTATIIFALLMGLNFTPLTLGYDIFPAQVTWYLSGLSPWISGSVLLIQLLIMSIGIRHLPYATRDLGENYPAASPLPFQLNQNTSQQAYPAMMRPLGDYDRLTWHAGSAWARIGLWRRGLPMRAWLLLIVGFLLGVAMIGYQYWSGRVPKDILPFAWAMCSMMAVMTAFVTTGMWVQRGQYLPVEFMRPMTRQQFASDVTWAITLELWPLSLAPLGHLVVGPVSGHSLAATLTLFVWSLSLIALTIFGALLFHTSHRKWLTGIPATVICFFSVQAQVVSYFAVSTSDRVGHLDETITWLAGLTIPVALISAIGLWWSYRCIREREWGMG
ncbi:MAG: hypothetical protein KDA58_08820 [Planctomycetaceae bacterium]|nr:hypothetical protein [Planctomycetaceae bacterium]